MGRFNLKQNKKILCLIQARLNSQRFPKKMLTKLNGEEILKWVIFRLKRNRNIKIVLATSKNPENKRLVNLAKKCKIDYFVDTMGSEDDVLGRFIRAGEFFKEKTIIRVCADNPLVDPFFIDDLIKNFKNKKIDYMCNHIPNLNSEFVDGFGAEIFSLNALKKIYQLTQKNKYLEHVTLYIRENLNRFNVKFLTPTDDQKFPSLKFDIDTKNDFEKMNTFIKTKKIDFFTSYKEIIKKYYEHVIETYLLKLFGICRSITGKNNRISLKLIKELVNINIKGIKSGKKVYDWTVPKEWNPVSATLCDKKNKVLINFKNNNLHLLNFSQSINKVVSWKELNDHLFFDKKLANAIPYRTSYYKKNWGFCVNQHQYKSIKKSGKKFKVNINTQFKKGYLNYGELILPGKSKKEILISTYICHPSMANDNLSGIMVTSLLAKHISSMKNRKFTYRIIFIPETIGAIAYLHQNKKKLSNILYGLVVTTTGGKGFFSYKQSFEENCEINYLIEDVFRKKKIKFKKYKFEPDGSDERQFSSQGFKINTSSICKDKYYEYPYYHTSLDNLDFVTPNNLLKSLKLHINLIYEIEKSEIYKSNNPYCEPMLSKHNLYSFQGGSVLPGVKESDEVNLINKILFLSDGKKSIYAISKKLKINIDIIKNLSNILTKKNLLKKLI